MNIYVRYFDSETLVHTAEEVVAFLANIPEMGMNQALADDIYEYVDGNNTYPKRYKIRTHVYFILIKTEAETLLDFKNKKALKSNLDKKDMNIPMVQQLNVVNPGWYEGSIDFKRVMMVPGTGKFQYFDTHFVVRCKAESGIHCYERMVEYLQSRVDRRSQYPSAKGKNFSFTFLGKCK